MHSTGIISSFRQSMLLPSNLSWRKNSGISFTSTEIMWLGRMSFVMSNQNRDIWVSTVPFLSTLLSRITSKQLIRSVATMIRLSPLS